MSKRMEKRWWQADERKAGRSKKVAVGWLSFEWSDWDSASRSDSESDRWSGWWS